MRVRNYCFTEFVTEEKEYGDYVREDDRLRCGVWQLERCPQSGRLHLQGYVEFNSPMRVGAVKEYFGSQTIHLERRAGTRDQAIQYCRKEESRVSGPWTVGELDSVRPGRRTDLDSVAERIQEGHGLQSIVEEYPVQYIKYRRGIEALYARKAKLRAYSQWREVRVLVYHGAAGVGKTRAAVAEAGENDYYILDHSERVWFDGYDGEKTLIIDDFYGWIKHGQLLRILDGYPYRAEVKGGFTYGEWTTVYITSNDPPDKWYNFGLRPSLERRITEIKHFE